jgi:hypothetical protein
MIDILIIDYIIKFNDLFFQNFFDVDSVKNIDKKIEVLTWCLDNDLTIINHPDYKEVCELFIDGVEWDLV